MMNAGLTNLSNKPAGYYESNREDMLKYIPQGTKTTLEFGCGFGGFSALLKERLNTESWVVEINDTASRKAAKKLDRVINSDAIAAIRDIPDSYFDCIIFFDVLEHLVDPYLLLHAAKDKLTENGVIVASIPNIRYYRVLVKLMVHGDWDYQDKGILDKTHLRFFTRKSILKMLDRLGFRILKFEGIHPTHSRTYRVLNFLLLNALSDVKYRQFAIVAQPKSRTE